MCFICIRPHSCSTLWYCAPQHSSSTLETTHHSSRAQIISLFGHWTALNNSKLNINWFPELKKASIQRCRIFRKKLYFSWMTWWHSISNLSMPAFFLSNFTFNLLLIFSVLGLKRIWSWEENHKVWFGNSEIRSNLCLNALLTNTSTVISKNTQTPFKKTSKAQINKPKQSNNLQWKGWTFSAKVLINLEAL